MKNSEQKISDSFSHHYNLWQVFVRITLLQQIQLCTWLLTFHFSRSPSSHHHLLSYPFCLLQLWTVNYKYCYNHSAESQDMHHQLLLGNNKQKHWKSAAYNGHLPLRQHYVYILDREREKWWECRKAHKGEMAHYHTNGELIFSFQDSSADTLITRWTFHFVQPHMTRY